MRAMSVVRWMKRVVVFGLVLVLLVVGLTACSTAQVKSAITVLAPNVGYVAYRAVPEARVPLSAVCELVKVEGAEEMQARLKALLGEVWVTASKVTTQDAQMAILALNGLVGLLGIEGEVQVGKEVLQEAIDGVCKGVRLAGGAAGS